MAFGARHDVHAPVDPIRAVHIEATGRAEHHCRPLSRPSIRVGGGVALVVGLDFGEDDGRGDPSKRRLEPPPDQSRGDLPRGLGEEFGQGDLSHSSVNNSALKEWSRFSAWSNTTDREWSITSSTTSSPRWAGRQCMKMASGAACSNKSSVTRYGSK